jgi:peptidoglycan/LPS O-acetylase OafA/YrhL
MTGQINKGFNKEIFLGLYFGAACIMLLRHLRPKKIDNWMGAVSYGCFLGHYPILVTLDHYGIFKESRIRFMFLLLFLSVLAGAVSYFLVELPTLKYRRRIAAINKETRAFSAAKNIEQYEQPKI